MKTFAVQGVTNPDIGAAITVENDEDYEKAKELALGGLMAWLGSEEDRKQYFPSLEVDDDYWYSTGYFEAIQELLEYNYIPYGIQPCFDSNGELLEGFEEVITEIV